MTRTFALWLVALLSAQWVGAFADDFDVVTRKLDAYVQQHVKAAKFSGSVYVARGGQVYLKKGYGPANRKTGRLHTAETHHLLASMTKQFTAALILKQVELGRISLSDRIRRFVPASPAGWEQLTLQQMINHSSGLYDYLNSGEIMGRIRHLDLNPLQIVDTFKDRTFTSTPGTTYLYTNSGYLVLGRVLEVLTGMSYRDLLKRDILDPLGMTETDIYPLSAPPVDWSIGYKKDAQGRWVVPDGVHPSIVHAVGDLYSTVGDLSKWDEGLKGDRILNARSREIMFTPSIASYGGGFRIDSIDGRRVAWHTGHLTGHANIIMRFLDLDAVIVLLNGVASSAIQDIGAGLAQVLFAPAADPLPQPALWDGPGVDGVEN